MTKIYIIRHAEAEGNLYRRAQGQYDSLVTNMGLEQIATLWLRFSKIHIDAVYSSDLTRAMTTARAISLPRGLEIQATPRLREGDLGRWEDMPWGKIEREEPEQIRHFSQDPDRWDIGSNESFQAQKERMVSAVTDIAAQNPGKTIAAVSHGYVIRALMAHILKKKFTEVAHCDNTGVSLIEVEDGEIRLQFMNDNSHLPPEISTFARQSWWKGKQGIDGNIDYLPLDLNEPADTERYLSCRRAEWAEFYAESGDFDEKSALAAAKAQADSNPRAVVEVVLGDKPIGLLELDLERGEEEGEGAISRLYLAPPFRGKGLGVQLLGHATSVYRPMGRERLTVRLGEAHQESAGFFRRFGFSKTEQDTNGAFLEMAKDITIQRQ